ncbi:MAG: hypothetical protein ACYDB7_14075 [Mycobacteriales bacterium]
MSQLPQGVSAGSAGSGDRDVLWGELSGPELATLGWARSLIRAGSPAGQPPPFGSREWLALADGDRRKVAAVVLAALCWWDESRPSRIAERARIELDAHRRAAVQLDAEEFAALAAAVRRMANSPTYAELVARRAEPGEQVGSKGGEVASARARPDSPGQPGAAGGGAPAEEGKLRPAAPPTPGEAPAGLESGRPGWPAAPRGRGPVRTRTGEPPSMWR